jgi:hypothetical protein
MHCELAIPGLLAAAQDSRLPGAELLFGRGRRSHGEPEALEAWLAAAFGMEGPLAAGALTLLAHGVQPGGGAWARADPVHLRLLREAIALVPGEALAVSAGEARELCAALNRHFSGRLEFSDLEPLRWAVRHPQAGPFDARPALEHAGEALRPGGAADPLLNEIQMVLHEHPVNEAREARGEPAVNGLWLWGAGAAPKASGPWRSVASAEPLARGLARCAGLAALPLPSSAAAWLAGAGEDGRHLAVLDALRAPLALGERDEAGTLVRALEEKWLAPLAAALREETVGMVTVHVPDAGVSVETIRGDLRRFWRRARPLARMRP